MDISGRRRFLPTFVPLASPRNGVLQFPGLQIPLEGARKSHVDRYPQVRQGVDAYFRRIGSPEQEFASLTLTGFLVPFVPRALSYHPFGRGLGGLFRTTVIGLCAANFGAYVSAPLSGANSVFLEDLLSSTQCNMANNESRRASISELSRFLRRPRSAEGVTRGEPIDGEETILGFTRPSSTSTTLDTAISTANMALGMQVTCYILDIADR